MKLLSFILIIFSIFFIIVNSSKLPEKLSVNQINLDNSLIFAQFDENTKLWVTETEAIEMAKNHRNNKVSVGFMDKTDHQDNKLPIPQMSTASVFPQKPSQQEFLDPLIPKLTSSNLESYNKALTKFHNRFYQAQTGLDSAKWIASQFETFAGGRLGNDVTVELYQHSWIQPSVIATIKGDGPLSNQIVIVGAHEDSINSQTGNPKTARAPGADDDGSGTVNVLEAFRILVQSGLKPNRTIQFMTYAAEEVGLKGSLAIAKDYYSTSQKVYAVLQLDMTAYYDPNYPKRINLIIDFVNQDLTSFVQTLVHEYTLFDYGEIICGYACSDHAAWYEYGYASSAGIEAGLGGGTDPFIHTAKDTDDVLDFKFSLEFTKLALAFAVELSQYNP